MSHCIILECIVLHKIELIARELILVSNLFPVYSDLLERRILHSRSKFSTLIELMRTSHND
jgi:hypothetical protein